MSKEHFLKKIARTAAAFGISTLSLVADSPKPIKPQPDLPTHHIDAFYHADSNLLVSDSATQQSKHEEFNPCVEIGYNPDTILNDGVDATVLEVLVLETCRTGLIDIRASFINPLFTLGGESPRIPYVIDVILKDDGTGEDKVAGDGKFTLEKIRFDPRPFDITPKPYFGINGLILENPFRLGRLNLNYSGAEKKINAPDLFVLDKSIPLFFVERLNQSFQTSANITNTREDSMVVEKTLRTLNLEFEDLSPLTNSLYATDASRDLYHFLAITSSRKLVVSNNDDSVWGAFAGTRRDFTGTGRDTPKEKEIDNYLGSKGELGGIVFLAEPMISPSYLLSHELTHWGAASLDPSLNLNGGPNNRHWKNNTSVCGVLYGTCWIDNKDGTFNSQGRSRKLSKLEQYLLGWIPKEQVPSISVALNESQNFQNPGTRIQGPFKTVTIDNIIDKHGIRTPGPDKALRHFRLVYLLTTKDRLATPAEMTVRELMANRLPHLWHEATDYQSTLEFVTPNNLAATLNFQTSPDAKWKHIQLVPFKNDGPGADLVIGDQDIIQDGKFTIPAPVLGKGPYVLLPDMSYTWRFRSSDQIQSPDSSQDVGWGAWNETQFRTLKVFSKTIHLNNLSGNQASSNLTPTLTWTNENKQVFLYEIQLSEDSEFETDLKRAKTAVFWNLVHAGATNPPNSWTVPIDALTKKPLLAPEKRYYWRVRPRIQGDGQPVDWTKTGSFRTTADARVQEFDWGKIQKDHWETVQQTLLDEEELPQHHGTIDDIDIIEFQPHH